MPYIGGVGLHIIIALFFAVHVVRTGREMYWLLILLMFPFLGSVVYFFAVYLPELRMHHGVRRATSAAFRALDPGKELREAQRDFELTPTAQNQMRLARAYLEAGDHAQAAQHFEACLKGPFANDPEIRLGAGQARIQQGQGEAVLELLQPIRQQQPDFRPEQVALLLARAYALTGRHEEAAAEFSSAAHRFGSVEVRAEYAIWALGQGEMEIADAQNLEIERARKHWSSYAQNLHKPLMRRLEAAFAAARRS